MLGDLPEDERGGDANCSDDDKEGDGAAGDDFDVNEVGKPTAEDVGGGVETDAGSSEEEGAELAERQAGFVDADEGDGAKYPEHEGSHFDLSPIVDSGPYVDDDEADSNHDGLREGA